MNGNRSGGLLPEFHIGVFTNLAAADASIREAAAKLLATELNEIQNAYDRLENKDEVEDKSKLEAEKDDGLNNCAPSLRYAVRRLIRGVSSSRECARQGFALGLTILVGTVTCIKLESLLKLIINLLEVSTSMKGQEARDCLLGRLFAYGALARSGKISEEWILNSNTPHIKEFTSCLIALASKKQYLQESAVAVISEMVGKVRPQVIIMSSLVLDTDRSSSMVALELPLEALSSHVLEAPGIQEWFDGATETGNPDALNLALKIQEKVNVDGKFGKLLPSPYSKSAFFAADHLSKISICLKESSFCQPRVHSVWPVLINNLVPDAFDIDSASGLNTAKKHKRSRRGSSAEEDVKRNLQCFCEVIIEGSLLSSSHDRKKLALDVVLLLLSKIPAYCVHVVLSYKVVQCLMDILMAKDSWLYKVAHHFLKELLAFGMHDDIKRAEVILALQRHSNGKFDCVTKSKTVKDLMADFKTEFGCVLFIQNLITMFLDEGSASDEPSDQSQTTDDNSEIGSVEDKDAVGTLGTSEFLKSWIVESLPSVPKHLKLDQNAKFRVQKEVLQFLAVQGLFTSSLGTEVTSFELQEKFRWPKSTISNTLSQMCVEQVQLLLSNAQKGEGPHSVASGIDANDLGSYFMRFLSILCNIPSVSLSRVMNIDDEKAFKKLQAMESQLSRQERNCGLGMDACKLHALRYLLIQLLLQILLHPGEFFEAASELVMCCKKAFGCSDLLGSSSEDELDGDNAPELMDVVVDTMLSLLPQSSAPLRSAIEQVFKYFSNDVTDNGLLRMLRVIKKDLKPARHQNTDDHDGDDSDEELLGVEDALESDEAETAETVDTDEQTDDSEALVGMETIPTDLPEAFDDDSDDGMDDDAMFRMDTYLARIFKERKNQAGGKTEVLKIFSNLAQAFINPQTTEGSEQLGQRIWGIIQKKIFKAKDYPRDETVQLAVLESLLEKYLKLAAKPFKRKKSASNPSKKKQSASWNRHKMINSLAQSSTFWILKIIDARNFSESELQKVCDIFKNALVAYFDSKKSQMKPDFLKEIFKRRPWIGRHLFGFFLERCGSAKSQFRQVEALDLVSEILKSLHSTNDKNGAELTKKMLKSHIPKLCSLIKHMATNMPEKQSRRADVRRFCGKVFQILTTCNLSSSFLKCLEPDGHASCESQFGDVFLALKRREQ
ncbi:DNA polymerase V [Dorcoceras hygrometricum]|uniref:DNA polymerase V n=1 Tax=Dorcoceras hygrometricum TaxID=472368 RepID=A0A2Z7B482_9LAMI|nr:DNA polymerase V [Dorcoceras hygrometricum]